MPFVTYIPLSVVVAEQKLPTRSDDIRGFAGGTGRLRVGAWLNDRASVRLGLWENITPTLDRRFKETVTST